MSVVANIYMSPPSLSLRRLRSSATDIGKLRVEMLAEVIPTRAERNSLLFIDVVFIIEKPRPGKSDISVVEINKWLLGAIFIRPGYLSMRASKQPAFIIEALGSNKKAGIAAIAG